MKDLMKHLLSSLEEHKIPVEAASMKEPLNGGLARSSLSIVFVPDDASAGTRMQTFVNQFFSQSAGIWLTSQPAEPNAFFQSPCLTVVDVQDAYQNHATASQIIESSQFPLREKKALDVLVIEDIRFLLPRLKQLFYRAEDENLESLPLILSMARKHQAAAVLFWKLSPTENSGWLPYALESYADYCFDATKGDAVTIRKNRFGALGCFPLSS